MIALHARNSNTIPDVLVRINLQRIMTQLVVSSCKLNWIPAGQTCNAMQCIRPSSSTCLIQNVSIKSSLCIKFISTYILCPYVSGTFRVACSAQRPPGCSSSLCAGAPCFILSPQAFVRWPLEREIARANLLLSRHHYISIHPGQP